MKCKRALFTIAFINLLAAALLSVFSFWVCLRISARISPHTIEIQMNEGSLDVADSNRQLSFKSTGDGETISLDKSILFQIAENLVSNAVWYAERQVSVSLTLDENTLSLEADDDGPGFSAQLLKNGVRPFQKGNEDSGYFGMELIPRSLLRGVSFIIKISEPYFLKNLQVLENRIFLKNPKVWQV